MHVIVTHIIVTRECFVWYRTTAEEREQQRQKISADPAPVRSHFPYHHKNYHK